jgi:hypothetical protein
MAGASVDGRTGRRGSGRSTSGDSNDGFYNCLFLTLHVSFF